MPKILHAIRERYRTWKACRRIRERMRREADAPGDTFAVGDRVLTKPIQFGFDAYTPGVVRAVGYWHKEAKRHFLRVQFDDTPPDMLCCMSPSQLMHERR